MNTQLTGKALGKYQIVDRIGAGGMGEVFRARLAGDGGFVKYVAIKALLPQRTSDAELLRRFLREAAIVARLSHPNIVQVIEVWQEEKTYYIAMELVDGHDFGSLLLRCASRRQPVPPVWIAHILSEILRGLDYAHKRVDERGAPLAVVHRDISPENILVSYDGSVKVTDFGVAKGFQQPTGAFLVGKPRYMAPEQAHGDQSIDGRADVYSCGVVLWEAVAMTAAATAGDAWDPGKYAPPAYGEAFPTLPGAPASITAVIAKATQAAPGDRYHDAEAFAADLRRFVAMEAPDFSPLKLGRFVAAQFAEEQADRSAGLCKFEQALDGEHAKRSLTPTIMSQRRREALVVGPLPPARPNGGAEVVAPPAVSIAELSPQPVASDAQTSDGALPRTFGGEPGTASVLADFVRQRRRQRLVGAAMALGVVGLAGAGVWLLRDRDTRVPSPVTEALPGPPPIRPVLEPPKGQVPPPAPTTSPPDEASAGDDVAAEVPPKPTGASPPPGAGGKTPDKNTAKTPLVRRTALLTVETTPPGATIRLNGKPAKLKTPQTFRRLPPGRTMTVEVALPGHAPETVDHLLVDGANNVRLTLRPMEGRIRVEGVPAAAQISVDGRPAEDWPAPARPGPHRVDVKAEGFQPASRSVHVSPGQEAVARFDLVRLSGPGRIQVLCRPFCKVLVDGRDRGMSESGAPLELALDAGEHNVEARQVQTARRKSQRVRVKSGETTVLAFDLTN